MIEGQMDSKKEEDIEDGSWTDTQTRRVQIIDFFIIILTFIGNGLFFFEYNYEFARKNEERSVAILILTLVLSCIACFFLLAREKIQLKIDKKRLKVPAFETFFSSGRIWSLLLDCFLQLLHPYPFIVGEGAYIYNNIVDRQLHYHYNDFLQILAMIRLVKAGLKTINLTVWRSNSAQRICMMYGCEADTLFGVKAMMKEHPISFLGINLTCGILMFSLLLKYCESPVQLIAPSPLNDLSRLDNCIWLVIVTMTTVGYGDSYPQTIFGRIIIFICAIFGVVVVSVMVVAIQNTLEFSVLEEKAFTCINKLKARKDLFQDASQMVGKLLIFTRRPPKTEAALKTSMQQLRELSKNFMKNVR